MEVDFGQLVEVSQRQLRVALRCASSTKNDASVLLKQLVLYSLKLRLIQCQSRLSFSANGGHTLSAVSGHRLSTKQFPQLCLRTLEFVKQCAIQSARCHELKCIGSSMMNFVAPQAEGFDLGTALFGEIAWRNLAGESTGPTTESRTYRSSSGGHTKPIEKHTKLVSLLAVISSPAWLHILQLLQARTTSAGDRLPREARQSKHGTHQNCSNPKPRRTSASSTPAHRYGAPGSHASQHKTRRATVQPTGRPIRVLASAQETLQLLKERAGPCPHAPPQGSSSAQLPGALLQSRAASPGKASAPELGAACASPASARTMADFVRLHRAGRGALRCSTELPASCLLPDKPPCGSARLPQGAIATAGPSTPQQNRDKRDAVQPTARFVSGKELLKRHSVAALLMSPVPAASPAPSAHEGSCSPADTSAIEAACTGNTAMQQVTTPTSRRKAARRSARWSSVLSPVHLNTTPPAGSSHGKRATAPGSHTPCMAGSIGRRSPGSAVSHSSSIMSWALEDYGLIGTPAVHTGLRDDFVSRTARTPAAQDSSTLVWL